MWNIFEQKKSNLSSKRISTLYIGARWSDFSYDSFVNEGYKNNPIVYRCIQEIAKACASIPFILYDKNGREIDKHPILYLLNRPNNFQSRNSFIENIICYKLLSGNVYVEISGDKQKELNVLRPDRITIVPGDQGVPLFYDYKIDNNLVRFPVNQINGSSKILHWKTFNPTNDWYGLSPVQAISKSIDIHNRGNQWNKSLLDYSCRPCGALVSEAELIR